MRALAAAVFTAALVGVSPACPIVSGLDPGGNCGHSRLTLADTTTALLQAEGRSEQADGDDDPLTAGLFSPFTPPEIDPLWADRGLVFTTPEDSPDRIARGQDVIVPLAAPEPRNTLSEPLWLVAFGSVIVGGIVAVLRRTGGKV